MEDSWFIRGMFIKHYKIRESLSISLKKNWHTNETIILVWLVIK